MIVIDTNALVLLMVGLLDENLIASHKRTSLYEKVDFYHLLEAIQDFENLLVLPNVWTEVDNLLNGFKGNQKWAYLQALKALMESTTEQYLASKITLQSHTSLMALGITDTLLLEVGKDCELLITSDSKLSDYAQANGIRVYDVKKQRNERFE